jgi:hypothetical protein
MALGVAGPSWAQGGNNKPRIPDVSGGSGSSSGSSDFFSRQMSPQPTARNTPPPDPWSSRQQPAGSSAGKQVGTFPRTDPASDPGGFRDRMGEINYESGLRRDFTDMLNMFGIANAPQRLGLEAEERNLRFQQGMAPAYTGLSQQGLNSDYRFNMRGNELDQQSLGLNRESIGVNRDRNQLTREGVYIDKDGNVLDRRYLDSMRGFLGRDRGDAEKAYKDTGARLSFEGQQTARGMKSDAVAKGGFFSPGHRQDQSANWLRTLNDLAQNDTSYRREVTGFDRTGAGYDRDYDRTFLADRQSDLKLRGIDLDDRELGIAERQIDVQAQQLGLRGDQYRAQLEQGLAKLGLDSFVDAFGLSNMLNSNSAQQQAWANQVHAEAWRASGGMGNTLNRIPGFR